MDYKEALEYIYSFINYEKTGMPSLSPSRYNLERVRRFLADLGSPHEKFKSILIAGTKGKGSTAAMCAAALQAANFRTALYSQPHLHTFRERARIDGKLISEIDVARLVETKIRPAVEAFHNNESTNLGRLTTYEIATGLVLLYFAEKNVDIAVLEIGLGGRLDAVNVVEGLVSAIAPISFDHTDVLGDTLAKIASEKAGIIKTNGLTIIAPQPAEALEVFERTCLERHSRLFRVGHDVKTQVLPSPPLNDQQRYQISQPLELEFAPDFPVEKSNLSPLQLNLPLLGPHQATNAALAAGILKLLELNKINVEAAAIKSGFEAVKWPGRLELARTEPDKALIVVDGAHNAESAQRLRESLAQNFRFDRLIMVVGCASDKDIEGIFRELQSEIAGKPPSYYILTQATNLRAATPQTLRKRGFGTAKLTAEIEQIADVQEALSRAEQLAGPNDLICVTGSLFVVAEARSYYGLAEAIDPIY